MEVRVLKHAERQEEGGVLNNARPGVSVRQGSGWPQEIDVSPTKVAKFLEEYDEFPTNDVSKVTDIGW